MPARIMRQDEQLKNLFREKIRQKVAREKEQRLTRVEEEFPKWMTWALKPVASIAFDYHRVKDNMRGEDGESNAAFKLRLVLSKDWILMNDIVIEPEPDVFAQIDHLAIGPPGIYIIETKAWEGAFQGYKDHWKRKEGNIWVHCESPTKQNLRHVRLLQKWLSANVGTALPEQDYLHPVVLFTRAKWLRTKECSMPVFDSGTALSIRLRINKEKILTPDQINAVAEALAHAEPLPEKAEIVEENIAVDASTEDSKKPVVETGKTKNGKAYVRVHGMKDDAQEVWDEYKEKGLEPSQIRKDRYKKDVWFFYFSEHL